MSLLKMLPPHLRGATDGRKVQLSLYMAWRHMRECDYSLQVNDQLHTPVALPAEKHHRYPINNEVGWALQSVRYFGGKR